MSRGEPSAFDWIVIGDDPGALLSGAMAARLGLSVLILPQSGRPAPYAAPSASPGAKYCLDYETNSIMGLGRAAGTDGLLRECLRRLELPASDLGAVRAEEPLAQVLGPEFRLRFPESGSEVARALAVELGPENSRALGLSASWDAWGDDIAKYWHGLPERFSLIDGSGPQAKRRKRVPTLRIKDVWKSMPAPRAHPVDRTLQEVIGGTWLGLSGSEISEYDQGRVGHLAAVGRSAAGYRGGIKAYREALIRLAKRLGARVEIGAVAELRAENGYFSGLKLEGGAAWRASGGALGTGLSAGGAWAKRLRPSPRPQGWKFTVMFEATVAAIPPGAGSRLVWKEQGAPGLEIEIADPADYALRGEERKFVFARAILPWSRESLSPVYQRMVAARMRRQLNEILPFFDRHWQASYPAFEGPGYAEKLGALYPFGELADVPEALRAYGAEDGVGTRSGMEGLFVVSRESYPEIGSLGPTVAALEAAAWAAHRAGLAGPFA